MVTTSKQDKETLMEIHAQSGNKLTFEHSKLFSAILFKVIVYNYLEGQDTYIPYIGKLHIEHEGDIIDGGLKEADLRVSLEASDLLKREIGSIGDDIDSSLLTDDILNKIVLTLEEHQNEVYKKQADEEDNSKSFKNKKNKK